MGRPCKSEMACVYQTGDMLPHSACPPLIATASGAGAYALVAPASRARSSAGTASASTGRLNRYP